MLCGRRSSRARFPACAKSSARPGWARSFQLATRRRSRRRSPASWSGRSDTGGPERRSRSCTRSSEPWRGTSSCSARSSGRHVRSEEPPRAAHELSSKRRRCCFAAGDHGASLRCRRPCSSRGASCTASGDPLRRGREPSHGSGGRGCGRSGRRREAGRRATVARVALGAGGAGGPGDSRARARRRRHVRGCGREHRLLQPPRRPPRGLDRARHRVRAPACGRRLDPGQRRSELVRADHGRRGSPERRAWHGRAPRGGDCDGAHRGRQRAAAGPARELRLARRRPGRAPGPRARPGQDRRRGSRRRRARGHADDPRRARTRARDRAPRRPRQDRGDARGARDTTSAILGSGEAARRAPPAAHLFATRRVAASP